jgi:para-aminobenzoate synthetase component I
MSPREDTRSTITPEVYELRPAPNAVDVFRALSDLPHCLFLDSAQRHPKLGRYSYVAADPFAFRQWTGTTPAPLDGLQEELASLTGCPVPELPAFQGGAAGLFAYDLGRSLETLPSARCDDFHVPLLAVGLYDVVIAFDHQTDQAWIVSQGWPERIRARRAERAARRLHQFHTRVQNAPTAWGDSKSTASIGSGTLRRQPLSPAARNYPVGGPEGLLSNFTAEGYRRMVERAIEYIRDGDIFQVNLAQRLIYPAGCSARDLYLKLRAANPAPFAGYFDLGPQQILSASPERFLQVQDRRVETRPIKGTRPRRRGAEADLYAGDDLQASEKDRAENVMIVDLMRNDLSRVCQPDSVTVTQLCELESYQFVQHLVSAVTGTLAAAATSVDLIRAAFPGGSITGAPKIRAMEIIAELEPHVRGAYCGSLGYLNPDGAMDLSILIRTITAAGGWWQFPVGGGIVAQSHPQREYEETWHKAEGMLRSILH